MATLQELADMPQDTRWGDLRDKVKAAAAIRATDILTEATPSAERLDWARRTLADPGKEAGNILWHSVAENSTATVTQIFGATDNAIQNSVNSAIDKLYP